MEIKLRTFLVIALKYIFIPTWIDAIILLELKGKNRIALWQLFYLSHIVPIRLMLSAVSECPLSRGIS